MQNLSLSFFFHQTASGNMTCFPNSCYSCLLNSFSIVALQNVLFRTADWIATKKLFASVSVQFSASHGPSQQAHFLSVEILIKNNWRDASVPLPQRTFWLRTERNPVHCTYLPSTSAFVSFVVPGLPSRITCTFFITVCFQLIPQGQLFQATFPELFLHFSCSHLLISVCLYAIFLILYIKKITSFLPYIVPNIISFLYYYISLLYQRQTCYLL